MSVKAGGRNELLIEAGRRISWPYKAVAFGFLRAFGKSYTRELPLAKGDKDGVVGGNRLSGLSSLYLIATDAWVEHRLSAIQTDSMAVQELRKDVKFMQAEVNEVAGVFSEVAPLWVTWDVVTDLLKKGVASKSYQQYRWLGDDNCVGSQSFRNFKLSQ